MALFLNKDEFDPNAAFGNPSPGATLLVIDLLPYPTRLCFE